MKKFYLLIFLLVSMAWSGEKLTPEEKVYLEKVESCQLTFTVQARQASEVWGRAVYLFTVLKADSDLMPGECLVEVQDYCLRLQIPFAYYRINKLPKADGVTYVVSRGLSSSSSRLRNQHIMAYYLQTGEIMVKFLKI